MLERRFDRAMDRAADAEPYFWPVGNTAFKRAHLNDASLSDFFATGKQYVDHVLGAIHRHLDPAMTIRRALDFGCGPGRVLTNLAGSCDAIVAMDVSPTMLDEAQRNCQSRGLSNVSFAKYHDGLNDLEGSFDLIVCVAVFQHVIPRRGERILQGLLSRLRPGAVLVADVLVDSNRRVKAARWARRNLPLANSLINLSRHNPARFPLIPVYCYSLNRIGSIFREAGCKEVWLELNREPGNDLFARLYARKAYSEPILLRN